MRLPVWVCLLALLVPFSVSAKEKVTLQLIWDHQFQFAGYYAADWKGFYAKENLEVEIRSAVRPDRSYLQAAKEILAGRADFGVAGANVLIDYAKGEPFLVLATFFQRSSVAFYYREELGRITPSDLVGLRVALSKGGISEAEFQSMLRVEGIDPAWVDTHPHQVGLAHLAEGRVDVVAGYTLATPEVARRLGLAVRSLRPQNHGVDFYGDSLITHRRMVDRDPRLVEGFVRATIKGWEYALDHTDEIARRIAAELPRVVPVEDLVSFNLFQAEEVKKLMLYPFVRAGNVNPHRWQKMYEHLQASGQVAKGLDIGPLVYDPGLESQQRRRTLLIGLAVVLAVAFLVVLGFMAWTKTLRRILSQRTTELRRSEERYALALEGSKDGVWDWDIQTNGDYFSPEWKAMLGFPPEELQPHLDTFFDLLHPEDLERVRIAGDAHLKEKAPYDLEFRLRHKQGHYVWVHAKGQAVWNENREAVRMAGSIRDITERKRVETLKDQFVSTLSHELRTPLTSIQGSLGLLLGVFPDQLSTEVQELVEISQRNAKSLVTLVNDLLDVRKIEAKKLELHLRPINVAELLTHAISLNKGYADGQGIPLVVKEKPEPLWVLGDWNRLTQVLTNLISNAVKFSNSPTPVEFEVRPQGAERVRVTVSDHGGGIPAEFHARVFEKFSQADSSNTRSKGGTGLGLSISESIIEAHQGTIAFVSRPGEGTSFYFDLPRHEPSQTNAPGTAAALKPTGPG